MSFDNRLDVLNLASLIENYACLDNQKSLMIPENLPCKLPSVRSKNHRSPLREHKDYLNTSGNINETSYDSIHPEDEAQVKEKTNFQELDRISEANKMFDENHTRTPEFKSRLSSDLEFRTELPEEDYDILEPTQKTSLFQTDKSVEKNLDKNKIALKKVIGMGQFGEVYQADFSPDSGPTIQVAVKLCKPNLRNSYLLDQNTNPASKLLEEAKVMQQFDHPHILRLVGICKESPVYIVIEFCDLGDLRNYILKKQNEVQLSLKLSWSLQLASALAYLEDVNYVHRDVAARNILLLNEKTIKLSDFGLSRVLFEESSHEYTAAHRTKLPIKWMAPESIEYLKFSTKTDVWGFGVCIWEIFSAGRKPYSGVQNSEIIQLLIVQRKRLEMPKEDGVGEGCPASLYFLMNQCWLADPERRPSFAEIKEDIGLIKNQVLERKQFETLKRREKSGSDVKLDGYHEIGNNVKNDDTHVKTEESEDENSQIDVVEAPPKPARRKKKIKCRYPTLSRKSRIDRKSNCLQQTFACPCLTVAHNLHILVRIHHLPRIRNQTNKSSYFNNNHRKS